MHLKTIGFVPTMGALHDGHLSLVEKAGEECDIVFVSVFVNPTQFNNSDDFKFYPKREKEDIELLRKSGVDFVFIPTVEEIYPDNYKSIEVNLDDFKGIMEEKYRPGHFEGVVEVVYRFFDIIKPHRAYFGEKDFQQVAVVSKMTEQLQLPIVIVKVPTKRTATGLAMSSRNLRLSENELRESSIIYKTLNNGKIWSQTNSPSQTRDKMIDFFETGNLKLEYLEIVDPTTLKSLGDTWVSGATVCIAAYIGEVRLIDNMQLVSE